MQNCCSSHYSFCKYNSIYLITTVWLKYLIHGILERIIKPAMRVLYMARHAIRETQPSWAWQSPTTPLTPWSASTSPRWRLATPLTGPCATSRVYNPPTRFTRTICTCETSAARFWKQCRVSSWSTSPATRSGGCRRPLAAWSRASPNCCWRRIASRCRCGGR